MATKLAYIVAPSLCLLGCTSVPDGDVRVNDAVLIGNLGIQGALLARDGMTLEELAILSRSARTTLGALSIDQEAKDRLVKLTTLADGNADAIMAALNDEDWLLLASVLTTEYLAATAQEDDQ